MKENFRINVEDKNQHDEAVDLLISLNISAFEVTTGSGYKTNHPEYKEITLPELRELARPKESEMNTGKKGRFLHQEWYEAFGRGEDLEYTSLAWHGTRGYADVSEYNTLNIFDAPEITFHLKPKTITIGSRTVVAPISVKPEIGTMIYSCCIKSEEKYTEHSWTDSEYHNRLFINNMLHLKAVDAINMADAILELMKEAK